MSLAMAMIILRKFSACFSSWLSVFDAENFESLVTPSTMLKISSPTVYMYLPLLKLPEEWLKQLSLELPKEDRLLPQDALKLAIIEDVEERKMRYDQIIAGQRGKAEAKNPKPAKRKYTRRTVTAKTPDLPVTMAEKVEVFRRLIKQVREIVSEVKKKGDNKLEHPV